MALAVASRAAEAAETGQDQRRLSQWVGGDLGLCLEIEDLPRHWADFAAGPLAKRLAVFAPLVAWREQNRGMLSAVRAEIERRTGVSPKLLLTQLLGGKVLFAIWPPADLPSGQPNVLLLAEAVDQNLMRSTLKTLVSARKKAGKWRGETTLQVAQESFVIDAVVPDDENAEFFITSADRVAMIATSQTILQDVLQRRAGERGESSLAALAAYRAACERLAADAAGRLFINPRAWDSALRADFERKPPDSAAAHSQKAIVEAWAAIDYVAAVGYLDRNLNAQLAWQWRADGLPPAWREVVGSLAGRSSLVEQLPGDALVATAAHADLGRLVRLMIANEWKNIRGNFKKQSESVLAWALAAGIGPDLGGYLKAPAAGGSGKEPFPLEAVVAVETRPLEPGAGRPALVHQVEPLLHAWLSAVVTAANHQDGDKPATMKTEVLADGGAATVISGVLPGYPRQELAYRVDKQDRLWVATSPRLLIVSDAPGLLADRILEAGRARGGNIQGLAYVNLAGWRELAARGRESVDFLWRDKRHDERASEREYRQLQAFLQLADQLLLTSSIDEATVHLSLSVAAGDPEGNGKSGG
ncbi:MAG TPA: hypothetical protein VF278_16790 [Pirellulales bacterium]